MLLSRREFLLITAGGVFSSISKAPASIVMSVNGPVSQNQLGKALVHEHFLVDFIGADKISYGRWNRNDVVKKVMPYLEEVKQYGVKTIFDCTPAYLGRDIELLKMLSDRSGLQIITNTGYYGAVDNKYLPQHAFTENASQIAERWINEYLKGIEGSDIKPGFIKISVNPGNLSELHKKLVKAAAITHLATGLTICSHTGPAVPAIEQLELLKETGVDPAAFVWVHAQVEKDKSFHHKVALMKSWISLDGVGWGDYENYADSISRLKKQGLLHRVLISHDAGWYKPEEPEASFTGYTNIFTKLFPILKVRKFNESDLNQLLVKNPWDAFSIKIKKASLN
jgi:phosphotriesterase-related protein